VLAVAWEDAEREARKALELLAGTPSLLPHPSALLARCLLASGRQGEALELAREAVTNLGEQGTGEEDALVRLTYAEALRANGAHDDARRFIVDAAARVRANAGRIGDASLRAVNLGRVWENARTLQLATEWAS